MARAQAARKEERKQFGRQRLASLGKGVAYLALLGGAGISIQHLLDAQTLPIESVRVKGRFEHVDQERVAAIVNGYVGDGFLRLNMTGLQRELEALPWVYRASIRRSWPATLSVELQEQRAVAVWNGSGLLNAEGNRFNPKVMDGFQHLPHLSGPDGNEQRMMEKYQEMQGMLKALGVRIVQLNLNARRAWHLRLGNGLVIQIGRTSSSSRLLRFIRTYSKVIEPQLDAIEAVDLRYTNGFSVRWKKGQQPATA